MAIETSAAGRTAAILTTGEVFGSDFDMRQTLNGKVTIDLSFTIGSLTSCTWTVYAGSAATPTDALWINGQKMTGSLTASTEAQIVVEAPGCRYLRMSLTGVGTVTSSEAAFVYRYLDYQTESQADGAGRID